MMPGEGPFTVRRTQSESSFYEAATRRTSDPPPLNVLVPGRLGLVVANLGEMSKPYMKEMYGGKVHFVTTDLHWRYNPFAADFGPVNLAIVYRFCRLLAKRWRYEDGMLVYCVEPSPDAVANASFLLGAFLVLHIGQSAEQAAESFMNATLPCELPPFRDATSLPQDYDLTLYDCLCGLAKAVKTGWFALKDFNVELFEELERPKNGDIHQITPKFVAFKGPLVHDSHRRVDGEIAYPPEHYVPILKKMGVSCIVRLNDTDTYNRDDFDKGGIRHYDLYFDDCTVPPEAIVARFLAICDRERKVAVHCRAGLGRTGTLIAIWMMLHAGFTANEAIAWLRIVRPGSVLGPQQHYLKAREQHHQQHTATDTNSTDAKALALTPAAVRPAADRAADTDTAATGMSLDSDTGNSAHAAAAAAGVAAPAVSTACAAASAGGSGPGAAGLVEFQVAGAGGGPSSQSSALAAQVTKAMRDRELVKIAAEEARARAAAAHAKAAATAAANGGSADLAVGSGDETRRTRIWVEPPRRPAPPPAAKPAHSRPAAAGEASREGLMAPGASTQSPAAAAAGSAPRRPPHLTVSIPIPVPCRRHAGPSPAADDMLDEELTNSGSYEPAAARRTSAPSAGAGAGGSYPGTPPAAGPLSRASSTFSCGTPPSSSVTSPASLSRSSSAAGPCAAVGTPPSRTSSLGLDDRLYCGTPPSPSPFLITGRSGPAAAAMFRPLCGTPPTPPPSAPRAAAAAAGGGGSKAPSRKASLLYAPGDADPCGGGEDKLGQGGDKLFAAAAAAVPTPPPLSRGSSFDRLLNTSPLSPKVTSVLAAAAERLHAAVAAGGRGGKAGPGGGHMPAIMSGGAAAAARRGAPADGGEADSDSVGALVPPAGSLAYGGVGRAAGAVHVNVLNRTLSAPDMGMDGFAPGGGVGGGRGSMGRRLQPLQRPAGRPEAAPSVTS